MRRGLLLGWTLLLACSPGAVDGSGDPPTKSTASAIVNGTLDTAHPAVVTVVSDAASNELAICTGTIVKTEPVKNVGWVVTAAHCISEGAPRTVWEGSDYLGHDRVRHNVLAYAADPRFDINKPEGGYDFAVIRISGITVSTPSIPLATAPDGLAVGSAMDNVGFGRTTRPPEAADGNSKRYIVSTSIGQVSTLLIAYDSSQRGACEGDSGGPWLVGEGASLRVVGIDSYGNTMCNGFAYAGRVQAGLDFLNAQLGEEVPEKCALCTTLAQSSGGKCTNTKDAALTTCVCTSACTTECAGAAQCEGVTAAPASTCIASECEGDAGASEAPASDAGPDVLVVHKDGGGCNAGGGAPPGFASYFGGLALAMLLRRRGPARVRPRPYRSARR